MQTRVISLPSPPLFNFVAGRPLACLCQFFVGVYMYIATGMLPLLRCLFDIDRLNMYACSMHQTCEAKMKQKQNLLNCSSSVPQCLCFFGSNHLPDKRAAAISSCKRMINYLEYTPCRPSRDRNRDASASNIYTNP